MKTAWSSEYLLILLVLVRSTSAGGSLCEIETGESSMTVSIMGDREREVTRITPEELPIIGDLRTEIALDFISSTGKPVFTLNGKRLQLLKPLTRDKGSFSPFVLQLKCTVMSEMKERIIPIIVKVSDYISERTLSEGTDSGKNINRTSQSVSIAPVNFDTFPYGKAVLIPLVVLVLIAFGIIFICRLCQSWRFRKLRELEHRIYHTRDNTNRGSPDYGLAWTEMDILWNGRRTFDSFLVGENPKNALSSQEVSSATTESTALESFSENSNPTATTAPDSLSIFNDSSGVVITTEL